MIFSVRINEQDSKLYSLCEWNSAVFRNDPTLKLQTSDLVGVKRDFKKINKIEILNKGVLVAEYDIYDSYSAISYQENYFVSLENKFTDCLSVTLQKLDLVSQVQQLQDRLETPKPVEEMTLEENRQYVLTKVAEQCERDIYAGAEINGELFTFKAEDQQNLKSLFDTAVMAPSIPAFPYHSSGHICRFYTRLEIITIYLTLMIRLIHITTYCNMLNMMIREMNTKEELNTVTYGMTLSPDKLADYEEIVTQTNQIFGAVVDNFVGNVDIRDIEEGTVDDNNDEDSTEDNN